MSETTEESPLQASMRMLSEAKKKLDQADALRKLADSAYLDNYTVSVDGNLERGVYGGNRPLWAGEIHKQALIAGCNTLAATLTGQAQMMAETAGKMLVPRPKSPHEDQLVAEIS